MRSRPFLLFVGCSALALMPALAHAAGIPFFGPVIPGAWNRCPVSWSGVLTVTNNIIDLLITLAIVLVAPLAIAYAGFLLVVNPVNPSAKEKAKKLLWSTVIGIVVALAAWLIVDALMSVLYNGTFGQWSSLISGNGLDPCLKVATSLSPVVPGNYGAPGTVTGTTPGGGLTTSPGSSPGLSNGFALGCSTSNDQNVQTLVAAGVSGHSAGNCCDRNQATCTSLDGMQSATVNQIVYIQNVCGGVTVTGGTETGHANEGGAGSHSSGAKVDISENLISCVLNNGGTQVNPPSFGSSQAKDDCGNIYTWGENHTDIYVRSECPL